MQKKNIPFYSSGLAKNDCLSDAQVPQENRKQLQVQQLHCNLMTKEIVDQSKMCACLKRGKKQ